MQERLLKSLEEKMIKDNQAKISLVKNLSKAIQHLKESEEILKQLPEYIIFQDALQKVKTIKEEIDKANLR